MSQMYSLIAFSMMSAMCCAEMAPPQDWDDLDAYNVVWSTPSRDASGSMPIGNGELGANVWVEVDGDLVFYLSRTDSWSETCRLLKLGRIRIGLSPNPFVKDAPFRQELNLRTGCIQITAGKPGAEVKLDFMIDAHSDVVRIVGSSGVPTRVTATLECWRTGRKVLKGDELRSSWTMHSAPDSLEVWESPDSVDAVGHAIRWRHRNEHSVVAQTLSHQGLADAAKTVRDPLLHRTFGGMMQGPGFTPQTQHQLATQPVREFELQIGTLSKQTNDLGAWQSAISKLMTSIKPIDAMRRRHEAWWRSFWSRSRVFVHASGSAEAGASAITRGYVLQRWMTAIAGRGAYPIKFNGSIFTVDAKFTGGPDFDPDWRRWGDCFWWQNTRLPYFPLCASGDFEMLDPLFRMYRDAVPLAERRSALYHNVRGAYFPETMTVFGTYSNGDYGWERTGHSREEVLCPWWMYAWQQGLELLVILLDRHDYTQDEKFAREQVVPMARSVLAYFDTRFKRDARGNLVIQPTQAVETYWFDVVNDTPTVSGLQVVIPRLLSLPKSVVGAADRAAWLRLQDALPPIPLGARAGKRSILPAESYKDQRNNVENPELYAVFPFTAFGVGRPKLDVGRQTYQSRIERSMSGWSYDGQCAALLGLTEEAAKQILSKAANSHASHRFPAMWGPNYDWLPDQTHGGNLMSMLQLMLLQPVEEKLFLMPSWPPDWDVSLRLHAPMKTTIDLIYRGGQIQRLDVRPSNRRKDVVLPDWLQKPR